MDHGYAVDVAHLLFTASADSHDTQRRRRGTGLHRLNEQWDSPETCGEKQSLNARPYNRNRVSLNRARGRAVYTTRLAESSHLEATNHFYVAHSRSAHRRYITPQLLLLYNYARE